MDVFLFLSCYARDKKKSLGGVTMNTESLLGRIVTVVAVLIAASLVLSVVLGIIGGLIGLVFRFGIPLLLAVLIVRWLTSIRQKPRKYYR
ncbi:predicted protein [Enterococcus casseliflavus EC30]|nr:predicted protein [Enterococcus casseliflavus EC30]EEV36178.1 predicted protein [Enterococcus casseliflavus EC10]